MRSKMSKTSEGSEERAPERGRPEEGQIVMPFYLLCDVSYSMTYDMAALNEGIRRLCHAIVAEPDLDDIAQICVMSFSDAGKVVAPLGQVSGMDLPSLTVEGGTNYGGAFQALARAIEADLAALKKEGYKAYRPCAFFLSDGEPEDSDWHQTFTTTLTYDRGTGRGMKSQLVFVPFGFRDAREVDLKRLAYPPERSKWYHSKSSRIEEALTGILDVIRNTVVASGRTVPAGQPSIVLSQPDPTTGITQGDSEYDPDSP
jgi:uncharacterized protein YegL